MAEKDWSLEQAQIAQHELMAARGSNKFLPNDPLSQWQALQDLELDHLRFIKGDTMALFAAVRKCANHDLIMPDWLARGFIAGYDRVLSCKAASWDEAFGKPYPKNFKLRDAKFRRDWRPRILMETANAILNEEFSIGPELWKVIADRIGVGERLVRELWYEKNSIANMHRAMVKTVKFREKKLDVRSKPCAKNSR